MAVQNQVKDGAEGSVRIAGLAQNVTERKHLEEQLRDIATGDSLTGLINRADRRLHMAKGTGRNRVISTP